MHRRRGNHSRSGGLPCGGGGGRRRGGERKENVVEIPVLLYHLAAAKIPCPLGLYLASFPVLRNLKKGRVKV